MPIKKAGVSIGYAMEGMEEPIVNLDEESLLERQKGYEDPISTIRSPKNQGEQDTKRHCHSDVHCTAISLILCNQASRIALLEHDTHTFLQGSTTASKRTRQPSNLLSRAQTRTSAKTPASRHHTLDLSNKSTLFPCPHAFSGKTVCQ